MSLPKNVLLLALLAGATTTISILARAAAERRQEAAEPQSGDAGHGGPGEAPDAPDLRSLLDALSGRPGHSPDPQAGRSPVSPESPLGDVVGKVLAGLFETGADTAGAPSDSSGRTAEDDESSCDGGLPPHLIPLGRVMLTGACRRVSAVIDPILSEGSLMMKLGLAPSGMTTQSGLALVSPSMNPDPGLVSRAVAAAERAAAALDSASFRDAMTVHLGRSVAENLRSSISEILEQHGARASGAGGAEGEPREQAPDTDSNGVMNPDGSSSVEG